MSEISSVCNCKHNHFNPVKRFNEIKKQANTDEEKSLSLEELNSYKAKITESGTGDTQLIDKLVTNFDQLDKNGNGSLSTPEIAKALARHHRGRLGLEEPTPIEETPTTETPVSEVPIGDNVTETPTETPITEDPIAETPTNVTPETPVTDSPITEVPTDEVIVTPPTEQIAVESPINQDTPVETIIAETPVEQTITEEPVVQETQIEQITPIAVQADAATETLLENLQTSVDIEA